MDQTERRLEIGRRYRAGETIGFLAIEFGVSRQRIYQIAQKTGEMRPHIQTLRPRAIKPERIPPAPRGRIPLVLSLRESGLSYKQITEITGVLSGSINQALRRWRPDLKGPINPGGGYRRQVPPAPIEAEAEQQAA